MNKRAYRAILLVIAFALLLLDKSLMIFEIRSGLNVPPNVAVGIGAVSALTAVSAVVVAVGRE